MHLYIHIPFCARRCSYCDFAIAVRREVPSAAFVDALLTEWRRALQEDAWVTESPATTIHLGGGTPSRLAPVQLVRLLDGLRSGVSLAPDAEIAIEANPDDVNTEAVRCWRDAGINRVSLGAQSFDGRVLQWMHRTHDAAQIGRAVDAVRAAGITNLSLDLIFALPAELQRDWGRDLDRAFALEPNHLSLYGLTVEPGTPLGRWTARGECRTTDDETYAAEYVQAAERFQRAGWDHYEVSNAAAPGFRSIHNQSYWRRHSYLWLGPSAHSAAGAVRRWNIRDWTAWQRAVAEGRPTVEASETLDPAQELLERRYLGLRTSAGVPLELLPSAARARWIAAGWAAESSGQLILTTEGWLRLDALIASV
jgi:oxygen-independent coproporphyrinogen-3 oxidase